MNYGNRLLYAVEAPELKYYDSGVTYLQNGEATVHLDPIFLECIEPDTELTPWQIWVECYGENDVYVSEVGQIILRSKNGTAERVTTRLSGDLRLSAKTTREYD